MYQNGAGVKYSIDRIEVTDACLTGRAAPALISKYLKAVGIEKILSGLFSSLKRSSKGTPPVSIFHQLLSSHAVKRFLQNISIVWRLSVEQPGRQPGNLALLVVRVRW